MQTIAPVRCERKPLPKKTRTRKPAAQRFCARKAAAAAAYLEASRTIPRGSMDLVVDLLIWVAAQMPRRHAVPSYESRGEIASAERDELGFSRSIIGQISRTHWLRDRRNPLALGRVVR